VIHVSTIEGDNLFPSLHLDEANGAGRVRFFSSKRGVFLELVRFQTDSDALPTSLPRAVFGGTMAAEAQGDKHPECDNESTC
jgi:hypothetical protein